MKYSELLDRNAALSELQSFLVDGENVAVTVRIPKNMRDAAKEMAELSGISFTGLLKLSLIEYLAQRGR
ncbi:hypothetical protein H6A16_09740 [Collinsella tanakaei]|uniref:hypothetical protein n=1 Tax=Collinsella tanakaei TaxID=626935 RepID=UPI00195743B8|nr:hypothetical protein [Collinsella tanakaei]MBM6779769.1 hypothetical protein [Collinsella tanakaei]